MSQPAAGEIGSVEATYSRDPWARLGWILAAVWLVFLAFPIVAVVQDTADRPVVRVLALAAVVVFGGLYMLGFMCGQRALRCGWTRADLVLVLASFAGMVAIVVALSAVIGLGALGMSPFLASVAAFSFPDGWALPTVVAVVLAAAVPLGLFGDLGETWFFLLLPVLIGGFGLLIRRMILSDEHHQILQKSLAVTAERDRVARDVHDVLGHSLTVVSLKADLAERLIDIDPERAKDELAEIRSLTRQSLAEIRATVAGLRIARLADERESAATAFRGAGIRVSLPEDVDIVDPAHRITMAWVLREATTNIIRHSGARRVEVAWGPSWLEIADDGRGLRGHREGSGLTGLRERVGQAGGRIDIREGLPGGPGPGTTVRMELP